MSGDSVAGEDLVVNRGFVDRAFVERIGREIAPGDVVVVAGDIVDGVDIASDDEAAVPIDGNCAGGGDADGDVLPAPGLEDIAGGEGGTGSCAVVNLDEEIGTRVIAGDDDVVVGLAVAEIEEALVADISGGEDPGFHGDAAGRV